MPSYHSLQGYKAKLTNTYGEKITIFTCASGIFQPPVTIDV